ncbi:MAG: hypothetical protein ACI8RZ_003641 [Myxococcota bacterium]|jgi:hypothetical protein
MSDTMLVLLAFLVLTMPLSMLEVALLALLWPPYVRAVSQPTPHTLSGNSDALARLAVGSREIKLRRSADGSVLFRRTFGLGKARPMYLGVLRPGPDGAVLLDSAPVPAMGHAPMTIAFGAFGGLTFGGGSLLVALILSTVFFGIMLLNRRVARRFFLEQGIPELERLLAGEETNP